MAGVNSLLRSTETSSARTAAPKSSPGHVLRTLKDSLSVMLGVRRTAFVFLGFGPEPSPSIPLQLLIGQHTLLSYAWRSRRRRVDSATSTAVPTSSSSACRPVSLLGP